MTTPPVAVDGVVITADALRDALAAGRPVVVLEVRRETDDGERRLPHARAVSLAADLVGPPAEGAGNLPLPSEDQIQDRVRRWGINAETLVVSYSPENPALAARAWWTLKWAGVPDVRVLDGGITEWVAAGGELVAPDTSDIPDAAGTLVVRPGGLPTIGADEAAALARSGVLLDARTTEAYTGEQGGGHIPGAASLPGSGLVDEGGRLRSDDDLRHAYTSVGVDGGRRVGVYCGGGTTATLEVLALARIGVDAALYPGSFSAYASDPDRPVATGTEPG